MSEETHNEGSEEEKNPVGDSHDEDFGLPDLEFEELQELDLNMDDEAAGEESASGDAAESGQEILQGSDDIDMSVLDDIEVPEAEATEPAPEPAAEPEMEVSAPIESDSEGPSDVLDEGIDEVEDILDSAQLISDRLGDEEVEESVPSADFGSDINYDDLIGAVAGDEEALTNISTPDEPATELDLEDIPGLTPEEIAALEAMDLEDSATPTETTTEQSDDLLADINSPDELAALGLEDEDPTLSIEDESAAGDSIFTADSGDEDVFSPTESSEEDSAFASTEGSMFETEEINLQGEEKIDFEPPEEPSLPPNYKPYSYEEASKGSFTKYIVFGAIGFVLVGFIFYFFSQGGPETEEPTKQVARTETPQKKPTTKQPATKTTKTATSGTSTAKTDKTPAQKPATKSNTQQTRKASSTSNNSRAQRKVQPAQSANAGDIVQVTDKRGRSYVIVGSFIDQDLAMDYAKELSSQGNGVKIIHPFGTTKRYRVSVADFGTYTDAAGQLSTYKSTFGDQVWALKY